MSCQDCARYLATADRLECELVLERARLAEIQEKMKLYEAQMAEVLTELRLRREAAEYGPLGRPS